MTYQESAELVGNRDFQTRVIAAASEQALIFVDDARPEFILPAQAVILTPDGAIPFINLVAAQPAITEESTDPDILAALQAVWPKYGAALIAADGAAPAVE